MTTMHPRVGLHQVAMPAMSTAEFIDHCRAIGVHNMTLVTPTLFRNGEMERTRLALASGGVAVETVNHPFALHPNLELDEGQAAAEMMRAIVAATRLGARSIYLLTGARGTLDWEGAAARFSDLIAPCREAARAQGIRLLIENASGFNADIHIAHSLSDTIRLAEMADIGVCIDLHPCWVEADLKALFRQATPLCGLVQVSDYVLGDRTTPCRAVPGDGAIPLERMIGDLLALGYDGVFDLELVGPRIEAEGAAAASIRAAERLSEILIRLGA